MHTVKHRRRGTGPTRDTCAASRQAGNVCLFVPYEGADHFIAFSHDDDIQERTADFVYEQVLLPLGYGADAAAA